MPIGIVQSVDTEKGTVSVMVQSRSGTRPIPRVRLMKDGKIPEINTRILIFKDGRNYYYMGQPEAITPEAEEDRASQENVAGDEFLGDPDGAHMHIRTGGMVALMADKITGFIANKATGIIQLLGKILSFDTTYYHKLVRTQGRNTKVDQRIAGSPNGIPLSLEMLKYIMTTEDGKIVMDLSAFSEIKGRLLINPVSGRVLGADINLEGQTPMGVTTFSFDGSTGDVNISSCGRIKVDAALAVLVNSEGSPLDRVRTAKDQCWATGGICGGGSSKLFVGKGIL